MGARAKVGGEVGRNGEFYRGGSFLPSTQLPKRSPAARQAATRRALVKPGVLETVPAGCFAIFPRIQPFILIDGDKAKPKYPDEHTAVKYYFDSSNELHRLIAAYNSGTLYE